MGERIIDRKSDDMYVEDMVKYSIIVTRRRAFPEVRDNFKPVQRRTLYDIYALGATPGHPKKSARITGDTIGKYHPHGDSSVYDAMEPMANPWKCKVPLIKPYSNFGTIMGDRPPSQRYTEVALSEFAMEAIFRDLRKSEHSVNWLDNFDRSCQEPEYLPVAVPLLLINGTFGIGVATSNSNIPPHNMVDVINATRTLIRDPNADIILIPDHCTPIEIIDTDWAEISRTGYGSYKVKGVIETEESKGCPVLHIRSLPDGLSSEMVKSKIYDLIAKKQLPMITKVGERSNNRIGIDIMITLKKGSDPKYVEEILYSKVGIRTSERVNFFVVDGVNPTRMSYKDYLLSFLDTRATEKFRIYCNEYKVNRTRCHKLETYIKVIKSGKIEEIISFIRKQKTIDNNELVEYLIKKLDITDLQANFILSTNVRELSRGYLDKYTAEYNKLIAEQEHIRAAITDDGKIILSEIDQELEYFAKKYGTPRTCKVIKEDTSNGIPKGTFKIVLTNKNYLRKIPDNDRITTVRGDTPKFISRLDNTENLLIFDNKGKVYKMPVSKIPLTDKSSTGVDIRILAKGLTADIIWMCPEKAIEAAVKSKGKHYMVVCTKGNIIKKLDMEDFLNVSLSGLLYSKLKDDDEVCGLAIAPAELDIVIYSKQKALRTSVSEIPLLKRNASGSKAMDTNFPVEGISVLYPDTDLVVVVTKQARINVFPISGLPQHKRARQGNSAIKLSGNDSIIAIYGARSTDRLKLTTADKGIIEVPLHQFKPKSGVAAGERLTEAGTVVRCDLLYD